MTNPTFNFLPTLSFITFFMPPPFSFTMIPYVMAASWADHLLNQAVLEFSNKKNTIVI